MDRYILDAYAILAYLKDEAEANIITELLGRAKEGKAKVFINWVTMGEVYYITCRESNENLALAAIEMIKAWPVTLIACAEKEIITAAGIKANYTLSFADAIVAATAKQQDATIVTGDPEFKTLEETYNVKLLWLAEK
ncbi:type II toxin-antitoxin system VapC family toxin [Dehalococcoidales bacterium]|nr:type II toxin-antitoxin system VapC family toxin [Dehalococcoidales bacterium]